MREPRRLWAMWLHHYVIPKLLERWAPGVIRSRVTSDPTVASSLPLQHMETKNIATPWFPANFQLNRGFISIHLHGKIFLDCSLGELLRFRNGQNISNNTLFQWLCLAHICKNALPAQNPKERWRNLSGPPGRNQILLRLPLWGSVVFLLISRFNKADRSERSAAPVEVCQLWIYILHCPHSVLLTWAHSP